MICLRCGKENNDEAPECSNCFYKFRFGYGYKDPAKGDRGFLVERLTVGVLSVIKFIKYTSGRSRLKRKR